MTNRSKLKFWNLKNTRVKIKKISVRNTQWQTWQDKTVDPWIQRQINRNNPILKTKKKNDLSKIIEKNQQHFGVMQQNENYRETQGLKTTS